MQVLSLLSMSTCILRLIAHTAPTTTHTVIITTITMAHIPRLLSDVMAGFIGQFDLATLLISLVSSVTLLAVAKSVVECLAFQVLPLRFIYKQYRTIDVRGKPAVSWPNHPLTLTVDVSVSRLAHCVCACGVW